MAEPVKRDYRSELRATQAAQTRRTIVTAAAELFVAQGYGATTIDAVAGAAGVSRKTVFASVGGKAQLLKTAVDWAVAGDDEREAVRDRPRMRALLAEADPSRMLAEWTAVMVEIDQRVAGLFRALEVAAETDDDAAALRDELRGQRLTGARAVVKRLGELNALAAGLSHREAADIAWLATDPVLYERFVLTRGWTVRRFEAWLSALLTAQLLDRQK